MTYYLQAILGALVWLVANVVYVDLKRKGIRGFTRFAAFWVGTPTTWISLFAVREGSQPVFDPPPDDEGDALLAEIRRDRALAAGSDAGGDPEGETDGRETGDRETGDGETDRDTTDEDATGEDATDEGPAGGTDDGPAGGADGGGGHGTDSDSGDGWKGLAR